MVPTWFPRRPRPRGEGGEVPSSLISARSLPTRVAVQIPHAAPPQPRGLTQKHQISFQARFPRTSRNEGYGSERNKRTGFQNFQAGQAAPENIKRLIFPGFLGSGRVRGRPGEPGRAWESQGEAQSSRESSGELGGAPRSTREPLSPSPLLFSN